MFPESCSQQYNEKKDAHNTPTKERKKKKKEKKREREKKKKVRWVVCLWIVTVGVLG
jgi:hypothetical protein